MTSLAFASFTLTENARPVTLEEMFRFYAAKSGIEQFSFSELIGSDRNNNNSLFQVKSNLHYVDCYDGFLHYQDSGDASANLPATYIGDPNEYLYPGDPTSISSAQLPASYLLEFSLLPNASGRTVLDISVKESADRSSYLRIYYDSGTDSSHGSIPSSVFSCGYGNYLNYSQTNGYWGTYGDTPTSGKLEIGVFESQYESDSTVEIWVAAWINRRLIAYSTATGVPIANVSHGMSIQSGNTFHKMRLSDAGEIIPFTSSDPGSNYVNAIQLALEDRYVKYFSRGNGSLRVQTPFYKVLNVPDNQMTPNFPTQLRSPFKVTNGTSKIWYLDNAMILDGISVLSKTGGAGVDMGDLIVNGSFASQIDRQAVFDFNQIKTHVRELGAFNFVQFEDDYLNQLAGHRYQEVTSSSSYNTRSDFYHSVLYFHKIRESVYRTQITFEGLPLIEPEDIIVASMFSDPTKTLPFWVDQVSWTNGPGVSLVCTLQLRICSPALLYTPTSAFSGTRYFSKSLIYL